MPFSTLYANDPVDNCLNPGGCGRIWGLRGREGEWGKPSQQHVAPCVKGVKWGLGRRSLRIVAVFWAGIPRFLQPINCVGYNTGGRRSTTPSTRCHPDTLLVGTYDTQGNGGRILFPLRGLIISFFPVPYPLVLSMSNIYTLASRAPHLSKYEYKKKNFIV